MLSCAAFVACHCAKITNEPNIVCVPIDYECVYVGWLYL